MTPKENHINSFLATAKSDIEVSALLYEKKYFAQSAFYLQQAVEKANKAFGVFAEYLDVNEFKDVGHSHADLHKKVVGYQIARLQEFEERKVEFEPFFKIILNGPGPDYKDHIKELETIRHIKDQVNRIDILNPLEETRITEMINNAMQIEEEFNFKLNMSDETITEMNRDTKAWMINFTQKLKPFFPFNELKDFEELCNNADDLNQLTAGILEILDTILKITPAYFQIYLLGFITSNLFKVRYPDIENGFDPNTSFTNNLPFLKNLPVLIEIATKAINQLNSTLITGDIGKP